MCVYVHVRMYVKRCFCFKGKVTVNEIIKNVGILIFFVCFTGYKGGSHPSDKNSTHDGYRNSHNIRATIGNV